ncbi:MAG: hypothetical protein CMN28_02190 [Salinisphaeraceae bacterium]|nr:hypothetical protein [Salinisphaeraceae bacterium]
MKISSHIIFWVLPVAVCAALLGLYLSEIPVLMALTAPEFNREFGLLENFQNLLLLGILGCAFYGAKGSIDWLARSLFGFVAAGAVFVLLEELDYGTHHWWWINGWDMATRPGFNIHNQGDNSDLMKDTSDILLVLMFLVFPWLGRKSDNVWIRYFRPSRLFNLSLIASMLFADVAHYIGDHHPPQNHYLAPNIGEFRELFTYYIWFLYIGTLTLYRAWPGGREVDTQSSP